MTINLRHRAKALKLCVAAIVSAMVLAMWMAVVISIHVSRESTLKDMGANAANLAFAFDDEVTHSLDTVSTIMDAVAHRMRAKGSNMNIYAWSREIPIKTGPVIEAGIIAPNGMLIANTEIPDLKPIDVSDREHLRIQLDGQFKGLYIGSPINSRTDNQILIPISKRVEASDGRFIGVLVFLLSPAKVTTLFKSINLGQYGTIGLIGADNIVLARFSKNSPEGLDGIGQSIANNYGPGFVPESIQGSYIRQSKLDHIPRLYSYRRVTGYPLFVSVGLGYDEGLAMWRTNAKIILALAAVTTLLLAVLALYLLREIGRRTKRDIELTDDRNKLRIANIELMDERGKLRTVNLDLTGERGKLEESNAALTDERGKLRTANLDLANERGKLEISNTELTEERAKLRMANVDLTSERGKLEMSNTALTDERSKLQTANVDLTSERGKLQVANSELVESKQQAHVANHAKSLFLANMSHELRTPLNAIIGFSQIIKDEILGPIGKPAYADYAKDIWGAGEHLLEIINNLLDISKIEAGKTELSDERIHPSEIVNDSIPAMRIQAANKKITLTVDIPSGMPFIRVDALRFRQVLINLISNAVKFTETGHVTVSTAFDGAQGFRFKVSDTGIGMSPSEVAVALEPFGQVENAITKKYEGTGLGLPLAQRLVELHGGRLDIESVKGVGTTITVRLPRGRVIWPVPHFAA